MLGIASGGKGVGLGFVDQIDARHGQSGALRQFVHDVVELRCTRRIDFLRLVHAQHDLVGEPVGEDVHRAAERKREQHAVCAAEGGTDDAKQRHDARHQDSSLEPVSEHSGFPSNVGYRSP